jgi:V/A-type H+-transporting ATPase subunit K
MNKARFAACVLLTVILLAVYVGTAIAEGKSAETGAAKDPESVKWAYAAAAISVGMACIGAGIAVAYVGAAAVGGIAEKPEIATRALIFVGLAEGIAIYGLIIAIMILGKV